MRQLENSSSDERNKRIAAAAGQMAAHRLGRERQSGVAIGSDADYVVGEIQQTMMDLQKATRDSGR